MKRMRYQPWVGLPNILCRDFVVPELLQDDATPAGAGRERAGLARRAGAPRARCGSASTALHHLLRRDTARTRHRCHRESPRKR